MAKAKKQLEAGNCWDCKNDPIGHLEQMFVGIAQDSHIKLGERPAKRAVFRKTHGVAHGRFEMVPGLPEELRVGVFALNGLDAWVRLSSDTAPTATDLKSTCGVGIKLFGVQGPKLLGDGTTQDFLLQNHDVFFVDTAVDMCEFTKAALIDDKLHEYEKAHPETAHILKDMKKVERSTLTATYWSGLPYAFGDGRAVKYKLEPVDPSGTEPPHDDEDYLTSDLSRRLLAGEARFRFMVQFQMRGMPLDKATVRWSEEKSPPVHVATLILPQQDVCDPGQAAYGENLAFNPWHCLEAHAPKGSVAQARKVVYAASAKLRRDVNGIPINEPAEPRPGTVIAPTVDNCIVKAAIYPSIGVARVGNSPEAFYIGPEVPDPLPPEPGSRRDANGKLLREAARFRVYGLNAAGDAVAELTGADEAEITWTVHLANQKASWYEFQLALDIPEAADTYPSMLRNAAVADRASLTIDPGPRTIKGKQTSGKKHVFDTGTFQGTSVYLGELRTDEAGRLIVLGGRGHSASSTGARAATFANNENWHDDISDGPVTATVHYRGEKLRVDPAWVVVAPPNYAPTQKSVRTMFDLLTDVFIQAGTLPKPPRPSFQQDILPIFQRMNRLQWVNGGFAAGFGWGGITGIATPETLAKLAPSNPAGAELRRTIARQFRDLSSGQISPTEWPWLYGDAMNVPAADTPRQYASLTDTQLCFIQQWADGDCVDDYDPHSEPARRLEDVPVPDQPMTLTRAALEFCLADAFHPGCELTWPVRHATMYDTPYRILHQKKGWVAPDYGSQMDQDILSLAEGPLTAQGPGGLTRWMAVPWQTDTASCRSGYVRTYDPYLPSFWPARVPNQVLTHHDYEIVMDESLPREQRLAAFANRAAWIRPLGGPGYTDQINRFAKDISQMGLVMPQPGIEGDPDFPPEMEVEELPRHTHARLLAAPEEAIAAVQVDLSEIDLVRRFPHGLRR